MKARIKLYAASSLPSWFGTGGNGADPEWIEADVHWFLDSYSRTNQQWHVTKGSELVTDFPVGINTSTPEALLHVAGNAKFEGAVRIEPQGDLSMGEFTADLAGGELLRQSTPSSNLLRSGSGGLR